MSFSRLIIALGLTLLFFADSADAQILRRFADGGVQVNAPFVRVNVGPYGGTSVRAPFTAVDSPGGIFLGPRRRFLAQPRYAPPVRYVAPQNPEPIAPETAEVPEPADVDALPYPTAEQLTEMDDAALVETLRQMMARLHYRLSLFNTGDGWQEYLVLSREELGSPGSPPQAADFSTVNKVLPRYRGVDEDPQYQKISALPSFQATLISLEETSRRFAGSQARQQPEATPLILDPNGEESTSEEPQGEEAQPNEILPLPAPNPAPNLVPNANRGERSILRRR